MKIHFYNRIPLIFLQLLLFSPFSFAQNIDLFSPDKNIRIDITCQPSIHFKIEKDSKVVVPDIKIAMQLNDGDILGQNSKLNEKETSSHNTIIYPAVAIKNKAIADHYNEAILYFGGNYNIIFRVYNDAVVYRFVTSFEDSITITDERCDIQFPNNTNGWFAFSKRWQNDYQNLYKRQVVDSVPNSSTIQLPLLIEMDENRKLLVTESDLQSYPGLYFTGENNSQLYSIFPPRAKTTKRVKKKIFPDRTYNDLARSKGARSFPWRIFAFSDSDKELLNNEVVYKLAAPSRITDADWIRPGQVSWDWWNHLNITGVDFKAGINTETYKYFIDFAAKNHIPYIMIDDGWSLKGDLTAYSIDVNVEELVQYGNKMGVGIMLWCIWHELDERMEEAMLRYNEWGIRGLKVDFMDRDDQDIVDFYWRCAKNAADHKLLINFHGSHKPAGIQRTYPNVLNFEGVVGLEMSKGRTDYATPENAVTIPFTRMVAGPIDYTPGAMRNAQPREFRPISTYPMSQGTRCQQLAMYILYDAPLQMLADNPTIYEKNKESLDFITSVPTTWDRTIPLLGKVGEYVAMARKYEHKYFVGAMTNEDERTLTIDFSFLPNGNWNMEIFQDGVNADRNAIDYKRVLKKVRSGDKMDIHLASGGGWAAKIFH